MSALAAAFDIQPVPDRARFVSEFARLLHGRSDRKIVPPEILASQLRRSAASASRPDELVPVPLTAAVWSKAVFLRTVAPADLLIEIFANRQASFLCYGLAALDDETLDYLTAHPAVLTQIYAFGAEPFAVFANSVRVRSGRIVPPGGDEAVPLWEAVVGEKVMRADRFLVALFTKSAGPSTASLYDTIGQLDGARQRFALGLWMKDPSERLASMLALAAAVAGAGEWKSVKVQPFVRQPYDLSAVLMRVHVDAAGAPAAPAARDFWARVIEAADLPDDPAKVLGGATDDRPIDAAWLARLVSGGVDIRVRAERLDQFAFGQRVFVAAPPAETPDVFVAVRAFRRYRMLMVTLERLGIAAPSTFAAAARLASRMSTPDPTRAFVAIAQFQGALVLLERMRMAGTLDAGETETLVKSLLAVPLNTSSQYFGGVLWWINNDLRRALPSAPSLEAAVQAGLAGPDATAVAPKITWEGRRYRVDVAAGERQRLERVREKQEGATLDVAVALASAAGRLTSVPLTPSVVQEITAQLKSTMGELSAESDRDALLNVADGFPPGVIPPPNSREGAIKAIDELVKITNAFNITRVPRAAAMLVDAADETAAQALVALAYAIHLGDPDGAALLPGDVSRRHDFGFGQKDTDQRLRAAWMMPHPDVSTGVPWHVDGSLLGLDIALAPIALRRLGSDRGLEAPTLASNDRETFAVSFGLMNPFALTDTARDAIAVAIEGGRRRIALIKDAADVGPIADALNMDGWRRRAISWTAAHEPGRLESMFSLGELLALGGPAHGINLDPWGTSALLSTGCVCTRMPLPGRLPQFVGRRQIGLLATVVPDLNLHIARMLSRLSLPARLAKYVLSAAVQDFLDEVRNTDADDWLSLVRGAAAVSRDRIEDYVAAAAADGPLVPDTSR
jgi:hypothetical protein